MSGVVFDLDGTLIDSVPDIHAGVVAAMTAEGLPELTLSQVREMVGGGVPVLFARCLAAVGVPDAPDRTQRLIARFNARYETEFGQTTLHPGARAALTVLRDEGFRLGLCTNKPEAPTRAVLAHFGLADLFEVCTYGDGPFPRKPDPAALRHVIDGLAAREFLYVGDSETDAATAQAAGLRFVLYTEGYRKAPVDELDHAAAFDDFAQLPDIVRRLAPRPE